MEIKSLFTQAWESILHAEKLVEKGLKNHVELSAFKWYLYTAHQNILDALASLIVELGYRKPPSYSKLVDPLLEAGLVDKDFADTIAVMARNRNRLAHTYRRLELEELIEMYRFIHSKLSMLTQVVRQICDKQGIDPDQRDEYSLKEHLSKTIRGFKPRIRFIILFGSRVRGTYRSDSDYDIGVYAERKLNPQELMELERKLAEVFNTTLDHIDVVDLWNASNELTYNVIRDGIPLYVDDHKFYREWVKREYIRILDEEDLMDIYYNRFYKRIREEKLENQ